MEIPGCVSKLKAAGALLELAFINERVSDKLRPYICPAIFALELSMGSVHGV